LKSSIAFGELTRMRAASKTGGALGQVSDKEGELLQSAMGSLELRQTKEQFISQLDKIQASIDRWHTAEEKYSTSLENSSISAPNQTEIDQLKQLHPDWTDEYIKQQLSFNSDLSTSGNGSITLGSHLAQVNNNPGNLRYVGQSGASQGIGGFAYFPTPEAGVQALKDQIALDAGRGHTLESFINKFAPPSENDTNTYVNQMASALGIPATTPLSQIDINALAVAMARKESSSNIG